MKKHPCFPSFFAVSIYHVTKQAHQLCYGSANTHPSTSRLRSALFLAWTPPAALRLTGPCNARIWKHHTAQEGRHSNTTFRFQRLSFPTSCQHLCPKDLPRWKMFFFFAKVTIWARVILVIRSNKSLGNLQAPSVLQRLSTLPCTLRSWNNWRGLLRHFIFLAPGHRELVQTSLSKYIKNSLQSPPAT